MAAVSVMTVDEGIARLLPEGESFPAEMPEDIFRTALTTFLGGRRLDMRALASELGIGRATLYRRAGNRDRLLGEVVWYLTRRALLPALEEAERLSGARRVTAVADRFMHFVSDQPAFRRFLDQEPEAALRILTSKEGVVQGRLIALTERVIEEEEQRGTLAINLDRHTLAYVIIRIGESFLYADVIAENDTDLDEAVEIIGRLLRSN